MISMTAYWQQFKENIDNLPTRTENEEYTKQIGVANEMVALGVTIELMNFTTISGVVAELQGKAKSYGNEVLYTQDKEYTFYLPKITTKDSLIFAIAYYQHLTNYQSVSYQGSIFMFRGRVLAAVEDKKVTTAIQAKALLGEIQRFCQSENIIFNSTLFLKQKHESAKEYIDRIATIPEQPIPSVHSVETNESDELGELRRSLQELEERKGQLNIKAQNFYTILESFNSCHNKHQTANLEWQNTSYIMQLFYRLLSWIYTPQIIENMEQAEKEFVRAEHDLNQELATHETVGSYIADLEEKRQLVITDIELSEEKIAQLLALAEVKETPVVELPQPVPENLISEQNCEQSDDVEESASSHSEYFSFFKQHLPSRHVLNAVAVGAAAIAVQHLTYG
ncbi:hypothetical protein [Legionella shakespearei]|uniref:Uncharacterized protein n=1 Tax=Legionella shakespearei DSM 23087 TaxID=1122169 RepID=A0A0W0YLE1_9GAMM|nr:hypothetical protein [Legionella shakespearei]KTD57698.1 hypothetical protein Lsha_2539 [Legionella shakespearei DSM 23087]